MHHCTTYPLFSQQHMKNTRLYSRSAVILLVLVYACKNAPKDVAPNNTEELPEMYRHRSDPRRNDKFLLVKHIKSRSGFVLFAT
mgnify:CR=1 FL=1